MIQMWNKTVCVYRKIVLTFLLTLYTSKTPPDPSIWHHGPTYHGNFNKSAVSAENFLLNFLKFMCYYNITFDNPYKQQCTFVMDRKFVYYVLERNSVFVCEYYWMDTFHNNCEIYFFNPINQNIELCFQ